MTESEIRCPKCGSNQITANKKGFSGGKAVAGAILTGGVGLLAGTLGSNKVKITCLACGKEFKPGEGKIVPIPKTSQYISSEKIESEPQLDDVDKRIIELFSSGKILESIKYCKESKGWDLKKSKDYVDDLVLKNKITSSKSDGCFVATACYGNYDAPEVLVLRNFRDEKLLSNSIGKLFVKFYYSTSPKFAASIEKSDNLKKIIRCFLLRPIVSRLNYIKIKNKK